MNLTSVPPAHKAGFVLTWLPVLACLAVFAIESTANFGTDRTNLPLQRLTQLFFGHRLDFEWPIIHLVIRKTGHFLGYGLFSLVCFRSFWLTLGDASRMLRRKVFSHLLAVLTVFVVASLDEFHQSFLPNRAGQFRDVVLDTCGAVALGLVLLLTMLAVKSASPRTTASPG